MIYTIHKGKHKASPIRFGFWFNRSLFRWRVTFLPGCRYEIPGVDQLDTNKLVGVGFLPGHHTDSARFGWRYNKKADVIEILSYCYVNKKREINFIHSVAIGQPVLLWLQISKGAYLFFAGKDFGSVMHRHKKRFSYRLGTFFGGNKKAPHEMQIKIEAL